MSKTLFMTECEPVMRRAWSMPSANTFEMRPIAELLDRWLEGCSVIVDPFARDSGRGTLTNDLNPATSADYHMEAVDFLDHLLGTGHAGLCDAVLLDPPYSPRQIAEVYQHVGLPVTQQTTQSARLYARCKDRMAKLLRPGGVAITCGWNSQGFGKGRGFELREILLVACGGAHNDYIVTVETSGSLDSHGTH